RRVGDNTFRYSSRGGARPGVEAPVRAERSAPRRWVRWITPDGDTIGATAGQWSGEPEASRGSVWTRGLAPVPGSGRTAVLDGRPSDRVGRAPTGAGSDRAAAGARTAMQEQRDRNLNGRAQIGPRAVPAATYWRRRFIVLTALLLILVAAGWSLSQAL